MVIFYWWKTKLNSILAYKCTSSNLFANNFRHDDPPYGRTRRDEEPPYHTGPPGVYSRHIGTSFVPDMDNNEPIRREPMYERKRPSTPPPGAVANPNVAKYPEYVEKHIDRCG